MHCEHPNIIVNKNLYAKLRNKRYYVRYCDGYTSRQLDRIPSSSAISHDTMSYYFCVDTESGETFPLYIEVPCGKCTLCREKKARHYATRATAETSTATYPPLFVTLTYEDTFLPSDGVRVDHVQKFLKRFRITWQRTFNHLLNLRYIAVGEYGRKYHRPHYHLLLWNIPHKQDDTLQLATILHMIERAWCEKISKTEYDALKNYQKFISTRKYYGREKTLYYKIYGRVDMSPDRGKSAGYCMKYMRKEQYVPDGCNPFFMLSSRRGGGIGSRYLDIHRQEFLQSPTLTKISIPLPDGSVVEYGMPQYYKSRLYPCLSKLLPPSIRMMIEKFHEIIRVLRDLPISHYVQVLASKMVTEIKSHWRTIFDRVLWSKRLERKNDIYLYEYPSMGTEREQQHCIDFIVRELYVVFHELINYPLESIESVINQLVTNDNRLFKLEKISYTPIDAQDIAYNIRKQNRLKELNEIF